MDFVNFDLATKLKEKGFEWLKISTYNPKTKVRNNHTEPTISQVLEWLRKEEKIHISTKPYPCEDGIKWMYEIRLFSNVLAYVARNKTGFDTPELAELEAIEYVVTYNLI